MLSIHYLKGLFVTKTSGYNVTPIYIILSSLWFYIVNLAYSYLTFTYFICYIDLQPHKNNPCNQFTCSHSILCKNKITCSIEISSEHKSTSSDAGRKPPSRMYISTTAYKMSSEKDEV